MHHQIAGRQLSRNTSHRIAMFRNMVDSLLEHERIETTLPKAKELRKYAERVITLGKKGTLAARRRASRMLRRRSVLTKVFSDLASRYGNRPGGYTRILHLGPRAGDQASLALIELVDRPVEKAAPQPKKGEKKAKSKGAVKTAAKDEGAKSAEKKGAKGKKRGAEKSPEKKSGNK